MTPHTAPIETPARSATVPKTLFQGLVRGLAISVAAGLVLAVSGAFGSGEAPLGTRLAYWTAVMAAGGLWGHACARIIERWIDLDERPWLGVAALTAAITGPVALVVWLLTVLVFGDRVLSPAVLPLLLGPVGIITAAVSAINVFVGRRIPEPTHAPPAGQPPARFPERLPPRLRGATIHAVQAEDHYLRVHTDRGSDLILMRMSDALEELQGLEGAQTHRSWWVARDAVRDVRRGDGRATLTLAGGEVVPVSRRHAARLRQDGWY